MAANRFASGSVSGYIPPTSYEVMEEVYDESYEPTQEGQYQKERETGREREREREWGLLSWVATSNR